MTDTPTTQDLRNLADDVARDGISAHTDDLERLADAADCSGLFPGSVEVLRDQDAAPTQKARAFLTLCRNWNRVTTALSKKPDFDAAFSALAQQWRDHQALRTTGDLTALWESRTDLDAYRARAAAASANR